MPVVTASAGLRDQPGLGDDDVVRQRLDHVVDGERGNGRAGERFHFDAGLVLDATRALDDGRVVDEADVDRALFEAERMTERNEFVRALGSHDARDDRRREHRALAACDLVAFDTDLIGPYGYCVDISRTWLCGDGPASAAQRALYRVAREQIAHNLAQIRAGVGFREFSERAFVLPQRYRANRYSTVVHGVGLCDEYPAIYYPEDAGETGYDGLLEANMTVCLESYVGEENGPEGVKLEEQVLVTASGAEVLSTYPFEACLSA